MQKKLFRGVSNCLKRIIVMLWRISLGIGRSINSPSMSFGIFKCRDQLLVNSGPLILFRGCCKVLISVLGLYSNVTLKAFCRFNLSSTLMKAILRLNVEPWAYLLL